MAVIYMVRHGRAAAGWDAHPDPGLDELGRRQAQHMSDRLAPLGPLMLVTSPLRRCQETAAVLGRRWGVAAAVEPIVAEIPSPDGVPMAERTLWLRAAMTGTWTALGGRYTDFRDGVVEYLRALTVDTVIASHFVAINAAIGSDDIVIRSLDNCSVSVFEVLPSPHHRPGLTMIHGGHEADSLVR